MLCVYPLLNCINFHRKKTVSAGSRSKAGAVDEIEVESRAGVVDLLLLEVEGWSRADSCFLASLLAGMFRSRGPIFPGRSKPFAQVLLRIVAYV